MQLHTSNQNNMTLSNQKTYTRMYQSMSNQKHQNTDCSEEVVEEAEAVLEATVQDPIGQLIERKHIGRRTTNHLLTGPDTIILDTDHQLSWLHTLDFTPTLHRIGPSTATEEDGEQVVSLDGIAEVDAAQVRS